MEINNRNVLIGVAIGGALGIAAGLMFSKKPTRKIMKDFSNKANRLKKSIKNHNYGNIGKEFGSTFSETPAVWGGVAGTVLGAVAGLFMAQRAGVDIRKYISDIYEDVSEETWGMMNSFNAHTQRLAAVASNQAADWMERSLSIADEISSEVKEWAENIKEAAERAREEAFSFDEAQRPQKIEAIVEWADKAEKIAEQVHEEVHEWIDSVRNLIENNSPFKQGNGSNASPLSEIVDWALLGINLWKNVKSFR